MLAGRDRWWRSTWFFAPEGKGGRQRGTSSPMARFLSPVARGGSPMRGVALTWSSPLHSGLRRP